MRPSSFVPFVPFLVALTAASPAFGQDAPEGSAPPPPASATPPAPPPAAPVVATAAVAADPPRGEPPAEDDRFWTDRLALTGMVGLAGHPRGGPVGIARDLSAQLRFGPLLVGLLNGGELGWSSPYRRRLYQNDIVFYTADSLALSVEARVLLGRVVLEAGGAAGGLIYSYQQTGTRPVVSGLPYGRLMATVSTPLQGRADVLARIYGSTTGKASDPEGLTDARPAETIGFLVGLRAHF